MMWGHIGFPTSLLILIISSLVRCTWLRFCSLVSFLIFRAWQWPRFNRTICEHTLYELLTISGNLGQFVHQIYLQSNTSGQWLENVYPSLLQVMAQQMKFGYVGRKNGLHFWNITIKVSCSECHRESNKLLWREHSLIISPLPHFKEADRIGSVCRGRLLLFGTSMCSRNTINMDVSICSEQTLSSNFWSL